LIKGVKRNGVPREYGGTEGQRGDSAHRSEEKVQFQRLLTQEKKDKVFKTFRKKGRQPHEGRESPMERAFKKIKRSWRAKPQLIRIVGEKKTIRDRWESKRNQKKENQKTEKTCRILEDGFFSTQPRTKGARGGRKRETAKARKNKNPHLPKARRSKGCPKRGLREKRGEGSQPKIPADSLLQEHSYTGKKRGGKRGATTRLEAKRPSSIVLSRGGKESIDDFIRGQKKKKRGRQRRRKKPRRWAFLSCGGPIKKYCNRGSFRTDKLSWYSGFKGV